VTARKPHSRIGRAVARRAGLTLVGLCAFWCLLPPPASAASPRAGGGLEVRLGFDGIVKLGVTVPIRVVVPPLARSGHAELEVDAPALGPEIGRVITSTVVPFESVAGAAQVIRAPVTIRDPRRPVTIRVAVNGEPVLQSAVAVAPEQVGDRVLVVLSDDRVGLAALNLLPGRVAVGYVTADALPHSFQEYAAVDLLVIRGLDPALLDSAQQRALLTWVRLGGRLLLIAGPGTRQLAFLDPVLPAEVGGPRVAPAPVELAARYGGAFPPAPLAATTLIPRAGAREVLGGGGPLIAARDAGAGQVTIWGFDPWRPPVLEWQGRLRLWDEVLGGGAAPSIDAAAVAEQLTTGTPLDPGVHAQVGGAILLYLAAVLGLLRWKPTIVGAGAAVVIALAGLGAFSRLAEITRHRSATLIQATVLGPVIGSGEAKAVAVAAVAVPYGGRYQVTVSPEMVADPMTPTGDLRMELTSGGTVLTGVLRPGEPPRPFQAVGAVGLVASASLAEGGRTLSVDLGPLRARHVELRWRDRVYSVGDLPAGRTVRELHPDGWIAAAADGRSLPELPARVLDGIFQGPNGDAILNGATPVLVGELEGPAPVFTLGGTGAPRQRLTILLLPLERR
jgi:hypothetical protein